MTNPDDQFNGLSHRWNNNMVASSNPTIQDDNLKGYGMGSLWLNDANLFICLDGSVGLAVWKGFAFVS